MLRSALRSPPRPREFNPYSADPCGDDFDDLGFAQFLGRADLETFTPSQIELAVRQTIAAVTMPDDPNADGVRALVGRRNSTDEMNLTEVLSFACEMQIEAETERLGALEMTRKAKAECMRVAMERIRVAPYKARWNEVDPGATFSEFSGLEIYDVPLRGNAKQRQRDEYIPEMTAEVAVEYESLRGVSDEDLLLKYEGVVKHRGKGLSNRDKAIIHELESRSLSARMMRSGWAHHEIREVCPSYYALIGGEKNRPTCRWSALRMLATADRCHYLSITGSAQEMAGILGCTARNWWLIRNWLEEHRMIKTLRTWGDPHDPRRPVDTTRNIYLIGPNIALFRGLLWDGPDEVESDPQRKERFVGKLRKMERRTEGERRRRLLGYRATYVGKVIGAAWSERTGYAIPLAAQRLIEGVYIDERMTRPSRRRKPGEGDQCDDSQVVTLDVDQQRELEDLIAAWNGMQSVDLRDNVCAHFSPHTMKPLHANRLSDLNLSLKEPDNSHPIGSGSSTLHTEPPPLRSDEANQAGQGLSNSLKLDRNFTKEQKIALRGEFRGEKLKSIAAEVVSSQFNPRKADPPTRDVEILASVSADCPERGFEGYEDRKITLKRMKPADSAFIRKELSKGQTDIQALRALHAERFGHAVLFAEPGSISNERRSERRKIQKKNFELERKQLQRERLRSRTEDVRAQDLELEDRVRGHVHDDIPF